MKQNYIEKYNAMTPIADYLLVAYTVVWAMAIVYIGVHIGEEHLFFSVSFAGLTIISALMFLLWVESSVQVDDLYWEVNKQNN